MEETLQSRLQNIANVLRYMSQYHDANMLIELSVLLQTQKITVYDDLKSAISKSNRRES